jgi:hypothetical protein
VTVAKNVNSSVLEDCEHFFPEETPGRECAAHSSSEGSRAKDMTTIHQH